MRFRARLALSPRNKRATHTYPKPCSCWFKADGGVPAPRTNRTACLNDNHRKVNVIEVHGPYQHGSGWPAVNGGGTSDLNPFPPGYPLAVDPAVAMGPQFPNQFASEFGGSVWSSFESLAPTLAPSHWGIHGGSPPDVCGKGFEADCNGTNVMAQRNYPTDNYLSVYFGDGVDRTAVGEFVFKAQLFQAMVGQALNVAMKITTKRLTNCVSFRNNPHTRPKKHPHTQPLNPPTVRHDDLAAG